MKPLDQIKAEIKNLSHADARKLANWLNVHVSDLWDKQIAADAKAGKLDKLIDQAKRDIAAGRVRPL